MRYLIFTLLFALFCSLNVNAQQVIRNAKNLTAYRTHNQQVFTVEVLGKSTGSVWGGANGIYTDDSDLGRAAVHAGFVIAGQSATVDVMILPGYSSYSGSRSNGITSRSYGAWKGSFKFMMQQGNMHSDNNMNNNFNNNTAQHFNAGSNQHFNNNNSNSFSPDYNFSCDLASGRLNGVMQRVDDMVFFLNVSGEITRIMIFNSNQSAKGYMQNPNANTYNLPRHQMKAGNIDLLVHDITRVEYYPDYSSNRGFAGNLKRIGNTKLTYFSDYSSNKGKGGKLRAIGNVRIEYHGSYPTNETLGLVRSIDGKKYEYHRKHNSYSKKERIGKLKSVGDIKIDYGTRNSDGKITKLGRVKFTYDYRTGNLKSRTGSDNRFGLY